jgi:hypothetical protein
MKQLLLAATLGLTTLTANAVCPTALTGKYSGSGQYTEQAIINNIPVISYIEYHIVSVSITGFNMTVLKEYYAATGANGPAGVDATGVVPFTFDKTTCTGQLGSNADPLFFVVSDSGNTIKFIHGKNPKTQYLSAELWELNKQ